MSYKIIFAGTPEFATAPLQALLDSKHQVIAVYTQPDRPAGRGRKLTASPVKQLAEEHQIPVFQPSSLRDETAQKELANLNADLMIVVAYGLLLPLEILQAPKLGCLNIHASLLPRWRGAAPIQRAIEAGDAKTGITIMQMDIGLDTGDMLHKIATKILPEDTAQTLHDRLMSLGSQALLETLENLTQITPEKQDETLANYAAKLNKAEAEIDWQQDAQTLVRKIQAFNPWPMAFTNFAGEPLRILSAEVCFDETLTKEFAHAKTGEIVRCDKNGLLIKAQPGLVIAKVVQPAGKRPMNAYDFGQARNLVGTQFETTKNLEQK